MQEQKYVFNSPQVKAISQDSKEKLSTEEACKYIKYWLNNPGYNKEHAKLMIELSIANAKNQNEVIKEIFPTAALLQFSTPELAGWEISRLIENRLSVKSMFVQKLPQVSDDIDKLVRAGIVDYHRHAPVEDNPELTEFFKGIKDMVNDLDIKIITPSAPKGMAKSVLDSGWIDELFNPELRANKINIEPFKSNPEMDKLIEAIKDMAKGERNPQSTADSYVDLNLHDPCETPGKLFLINLGKQRYNVPVELKEPVSDSEKKKIVNDIADAWLKLFPSIMLELLSDEEINKLREGLLKEAEAKYSPKEGQGKYSLLQECALHLGRISRKPKIVNETKTVNQKFDIIDSNGKIFSSHRIDIENGKMVISYRHVNDPKGLYRKWFKITVPPCKFLYRWEKENAHNHVIDHYQEYLLTDTKGDLSLINKARDKFIAEVESINCEIEMY